MTKLKVSTMALMAALSLPMAAMAQTNEQQVPQTQENQAQPADPNSPDPMKQDVQKADKQDAATSPDGLIMLQDEDSFLASDLTGATVYSPNNEAIGDVNDVLVSRDGKVEGIVVGVGGFLGIGEKDVAIEMSKIKLAEAQDGIKLVLDTTKEELAAAPEFKSKADMQAEIDATQPSSSQGLMVPEQPAQQEPAQQEPAQTQQ